VLDAANAMRAAMLLVPAYAEAATFAELREAAKHDSVAVQAVEALERDLRRCGQAEANLVERGWLDPAEHWAAFDADGEPMVPNPYRQNP
jgi:hypothetical protein